MSIDWKVPPSQLAQALTTIYPSRVRSALAVLAMYYGAKMEAYAKANRPWTDRTGNARQTLFSLVVLEPDAVLVYLSHGVTYGKWLELCNAGRYSIIMPTMQIHYQEMIGAVRRLMS